MAEGEGLESLQEQVWNQLRTTPWSQQQEAPGMSKGDKLQHYHDCEKIAAPFMNKKGRAALAELRDRTIEQPVFPYKSTTGDLLYAYGCAREGQNQLVRYIEYCMRVVEQGPPVSEEQGNE